MLTIPVKPIPKDKFVKFRDKIISHLTFEPSFSYHEHIVKGASDAGLTIEAALSLRSGLLQTHVRRRIGVIITNAKKIAADYAKMDIIKVADKWKMPPLTVLRTTFEVIHPSEVAKQLFGKKASPIGVLTGRDLDQFRIATAADGSVFFDPVLTTEIAHYNEKLFVAYFIWKGFKVKTEDQLIVEQTESEGRAIITPDLLFEEPIKINDCVVHWIDFKNYIGCNETFLYKKNVEQSARYNEKFGPGAIVYRHGFVEMNIPGTLLLDAREFEGFTML